MLGETDGAGGGRWPGMLAPSSGTPARVPGSLRRTSNVDIVFSDDFAELVLSGRARDLVTRADGAEVVDEASMDVHIDMRSRQVARIAVEPGSWTPAVQSLLGVRAGSSFRTALDELVPEVVERGLLVGLLLDEVPVATLISGSSLGRRGLMSVLKSQAPHASKAAPKTEKRRMSPPPDICAGWKADGEMMNSVITRGTPFLGNDVPAPSLDSPDDPIAWHRLDEIPPGSMRRHRRLDLIPGDESGGVIRADVFFRDSFVEPDGTQSAVHEYAITAAIDSEDRVLEIAAIARALPSPDCPAAAASAQRLVGMPLVEVRRHVREAFSGTSTCTHLNDALRSFGDLGFLVPLVRAGG